MDKPRRPAIPKFEDKPTESKKDPGLEEKLNSFMSSIAQPTPAATTTPVEAKPAAPKEQGKKKISLAGLNSKLNSMLSAKKIGVAAVSGAIEKQKKEESKKVEIEYDPQQPNNYEIIKHNYTALFQSLAEEEDDSDEMEPEETEIEPEVIEEQEPAYHPEEKEQVALRMMQKFGYKVGEGLGKQAQGIKTPLVVRKTTDSAGVIEQSSIALNQLISPETTARNALAAKGVSPTTVLVLVGLLSMQELEQGLEEEIRQECCLHGVIVDWVLFLIGQQLRIFVRFKTLQQAFEGFVRMNGKYFGQKLVTVRFYKEQPFEAKAYAEPLHEHVPT